MNSDEIFRVVQRYIEEHLEEEIGVRELCEIAGYSEYHFIRLFKKKFNVTPKKYVNRRRLIKASEDILLGNKIIDVALKYTWKSHSGFVKSFEKEFGFYPSLLKVMILEINQLGGGFMSHVFLNAPKVGATKEELLELLKNKISENNIYIDGNELNCVYDCACRAYENVKRYSGEEYVTHTLNVAIILADLEVTKNILLAGMLCDVNKKGSKKLKEFKNDLPKDVYTFAEKVQNSGNEEVDFDNDIFYIKIAERLHNMRTIEFIDSEKKKQKAKETMDKYIPLARTLNNQKLLDELNDLSLKYYQE